MEFDELKNRYAKEPWRDPEVWKWVFENVQNYVKRKNYPDELAYPSKKWDIDAYKDLWTGFMSGIQVKDRETGKIKTVSFYKLPYILDACDNIRSANLLLQQQIDFYFRKAREPQIRDNIARRVVRIFRQQDPRLHEFKAKDNRKPTYGLQKWMVSPAQSWEGNLPDLYHLVYSSLGKYMVKCYNDLSHYKSPQISNKDLANMLHNLVEAADRRLTLGQIMYVLGYKLDIARPEIMSLEEETEEERPLLETIPIETSSPDQQITDEETARLVYNELPAQLRDLLPFVQEIKDVGELSRTLNRPDSTVYEQLGRIRKAFVKHNIRSQTDFDRIWIIITKKYLQN